MAVIARQQRWQRGRRVAASSGGSGGQGVNSTTLADIRHHCRAATVYSRGGDEDTCGDSNGRGTDNNQQSTKSMDGNGNGNGNADSNDDGNGNKGNSSAYGAASLAAVASLVVAAAT